MTRLRLTLAERPSGTLCSDPSDLDDGGRLASLALAEQERDAEDRHSDHCGANEQLALRAIDLLGEPGLQRPQARFDVVARHPLGNGDVRLGAGALAHRGASFAGLRARPREMADTASAKTAPITTSTMRYGTQLQLPANTSPVSVCRTRRSDSARRITPIPISVEPTAPNATYRPRPFSGPIVSCSA